MRKKWIAGLLAVAALLTVGGAVYAAGMIRLVVNGSEVATDVAPQIVKGRVMVPISAVARALEARVGWDAASRTVTVETRGGNAGSGAQQHQLELLRQALAPASAGDAVQQWAKAVKTRNGAAQFAVLSPALQAKTADAYASLNWVTGLSSPWVDSFEAAEAAPAANGDRSYTVAFHLATSTGSAGDGSVKLTVHEQEDGTWLIGGLQSAGEDSALDGIVVLP